MSAHESSASQQEERGQPRGDKESVRGGGRVKFYLHAETEENVALLTDTRNTSFLEEMKQKSGADVKFDTNPSPVPGMKILIIRGLPSQIEEAVRIISQKTGSKGPLPDQAQTFWLQWVEAAFPDLNSRAYFLPPVYVNRVPMVKQLTHSMEVLVLQSASREASQSNQSPRNTDARIRQPPPVNESDVRDDAAMHRVLCCLKKMFEENSEVLVGMSHLQFGQYLGEPCYSVATDQLPRPTNLPSDLPGKWKQGTFDVLLIHRQYGFVVCQVRVFGDTVYTLNMSPENIDNTIIRKMKDVVSQLKKTEAMLSYLVSDIAPGLRITKTIAFPNLMARQIQQAISHDKQLIEDLCQCLEASDPADIAGLCLCCDQLSDPKTPYDVSSDVLGELGHWWQRRVAGAGPVSHMTLEVYKTLVARFCGPATTVTVPCTCPPRVSVKTLGQAVWWTGECYTAVITLFPEQLHLLNMAPARLYVSGPPGTGKTVVLLLMAIQWLRCGQPVRIITFCHESHAVCSMLYHLLLQTVKTQQSAGVSPGQPHLLHYDFTGGKDVDKAVNDLSQAAKDGLLYVIADEAGSEIWGSHFKTLCDRLLTQVPHLHLWAASCYHGDAPTGWQVEYLTRPLRSPPAVVREVEKDVTITKHHDVKTYSKRGVPDHTDGPPVRRLYHRGEGHSGHGPADCVTCGRDVASFLHSLRVGVTENVTRTYENINGGTSSPCLQWRDVLVLSLVHVSDDSGMVKAFNEEGIPVRVMKDDDIEDVATARSDVVWVARGDRVRGLERKVVVCLVDVKVNVYAQLHCMSRCTAQLVIVSPND